MLAASIDAFVVPSAGNQGDTIAMSAQASTDVSGASLTYSWDFGDGTQQSGVDLTDVSHAYAVPSPSGSPYTVTLTVDDGDQPATATSSITIDDVPPILSAGPSQTARAGAAVQFNGSASVPSGANDPLSYAWDFNYDGQNVNPGSANTLNPYNVFATPGTYTVALQATDSEGVSSLSTITVTVNPSSALVVNAGPDQALNEGDTASFAASYSDGSGTVDPATAQWDFNYDGQNFVANPSANGTLTPSYQFTTPGVYLVAVQLTDSNGVSSIGVQYVSVGDVDPDVDAGADQTVNQGGTVQFAGTASVPSGANDALTYAWDFDYDGNNFVAAPSSNSLTPTYVYTTPGNYEAALQVTDAYGQVSLSSITVTVNDVSPTATVSNSGPANAGSPVTFTVSNVQDLTPGDTPTYLVDWDGSGQFEELTPDELSGNPTSSVSFTHSYDVPGNYNAVVQIMDGSGGYTDYITNVVVNDAAPTVGLFGPSGQPLEIDPTVPIVFQDVVSPSLAETQAGFTYFVSVDGGAYTSSTSPYYYLPSNISQGNHTLYGYVEDSEGQSSPIYQYGVTVVAPQTRVVYDGTGNIQLDWTGAPAPVVLTPFNNFYTMSGTVSGLTITLLTSRADYDLTVNGSIATINVASGVQNVNLTVTTDASAETDDGDIGEIDLPSGSMLGVNARGDLGNIVGPSNDGEMSGTTATDLIFANLTGSITGLDSIEMLSAVGWLGTSASQVIDVAAGIGSLSAYGVGATVHADERQDAGDPVMSVTVGDGGVPGVIDGGNVGNVNIAGDVNVFEAQNLEGNFDPLFERLVVIGNVTNKNLVFGYVGALVFTGKDPVVNSIRAGVLGGLFATNSLTVSNLIEAGSIGQIKVLDGNLNVGQGTTKGLIVSGSTIGPISVGGHLASLPNDSNYLGGNLNMNAGQIAALGNISSITVANNLTANVISALGNIGEVKVWNVVKNHSGTDIPSNNFVGMVNALAGNTGPISVKGNFYLPSDTATLDKFLVFAKENIGSITVGGDIGQPQPLPGSPPPPPGSPPPAPVPPGRAYRIQGGSIDVIDAQGTKSLVNPLLTLHGNIFLVSIKATNGDIKGIKAANTISTSIEAIGGDIRNVEGGTIQGDIRAKWSATTGQGGNIWEVTAYSKFAPGTIANPTTKPHSIIADELIGKVAAPSTKGALTRVVIQAQGGGTFDATTGKATLAALVVDAGQGTFQGKIIFETPAAGSGIPVVLFTMPAAPNTLPLLQLTDSAHAGTVWTLAGPVNQKVSLEFALFDWNPDDVRSGFIKAVGYQKGRTKFSVTPGWSINGPAQ